MNNLPISWLSERINGENYRVIKDPKLCQIFWVWYWQKYFADTFKKQNVIKEIQNVDLTMPVLFRETTQNIDLQQPILKNIQYYADIVEDSTKNPPISISWLKLDYVLLVGIILLFVIGFFSSFIDKYVFLRSSDTSEISITPTTTDSWKSSNSKISISY